MNSESSVFEKVLPGTVDNTFSGNKIAEYFFLLITILTLVRSLLHMFLPDGGAESIATIDLNIEGSEIIIVMFYLWGSSQLLFGMFYVVVYVRYKSLIPLMYLFLIVEYIFRFFLGFYKPIETSSIAPGAILNLIMVPLAILMFILSLKDIEL